MENPQLKQLILNDGNETYVLYVTTADHDLAHKDMSHAQELLDDHKKTLSKQLKKTLFTNFVQEGVMSFASGSNVQLIDILEAETNTIYRLSLSPADYERALHDAVYAAELLKSYKKANNLQLHIDNPNDNIVEDTFQNENDLNMGNVLPLKAIPIKKKSYKASKIAKWFEESERCLLNLYKKYIEDYDSQKLTYDKLWSLIHKGMEKAEYDYTAQQCTIKLDTMKRKYKEVVDNNSQTGKAQITCQYYNELHELFCKKPWIKPSAIAGSNVTLTMDDTEEAHHKSKKSKLTGSALKAKFIDETLQIQKKRLEIQEKRFQLEAEYKKNKLEILKQYSGKK